MISSINAEKLLQHSILIHNNKPRKSEIEDLFNLIKSIYKNTTANIIINSERMNAFHLRWETKQLCLLSSLSFKIGLEVLTSAIRGGVRGRGGEEVWKTIQIIKRKKKTIPIFRWYDCLYGKLQGINKITNKLISEFSKITAYMKIKCISI